MTIINNKYKFIFVHIPKNAGTSISNFFSLYNSPVDIEIGGTKIGEILQAEYLSRFGIGKHAPAKKLAFSLSGLWENYYKFAVIRSPYTRFISAFNFLKNWSGPQTYQVSEVMKSCDSLEQFLDCFASIPAGFADNIFLPQSYWVYDGAKVMVDRLVRFESMESDLSEVISHIRHSEANLQLLKRLNANDDSVLDQSHFSSKYIDFIYKHYKIDFENFSYEML